MTPSPAVAPPLQIALLGGFVCRVHGEQIPPPRSRHTTLLLSLLALRHDRAMDRRTLAAMLWPESDASSGLAYLRRTLLDLRRVLSPESRRILSPTTQSLRLDLAGDARFDVRDFDRILAAGQNADLDRALALYRGPLTLELGDDPDGFISEERERLALQFLKTLTVRAQWRQAAGDRTGAIADLRRLLAIDPFQEAASLQLMRLLVDDGNRTGALAEYQRLRDLLAVELGAEPEGEILAYAERLQKTPAAPLTAKDEPLLSRVSQPVVPVKVMGLPAPLTRFVGRKPELLRLRDWIVDGPPEERQRLITISGSPGIGKTRLALETARVVAQLPEAVRAVWFVTFAEIRNPREFRFALGQALGLSGAQAGDPEAMVQFLRSGDRDDSTAGLPPRISLLVLDNLEHLLSPPDDLTGDSARHPLAGDDIALLLHHLLTSTPSLICLVTSQRSLQLGGEQEMRLGTLPFPKPGASSREAAACDSVVLFLDRARLADAHFGSRTDSQADGADGMAEIAPIAALCRTLEGVPLGIELAAARLRRGRSAVSQILSEISERQVALAAVLRDLSPRQRSLQAAIDWSYGLLSEREKLVLERLSVFVGGCDDDAARFICGFASIDPGNVPALLQRLVDHSLLIAENTGEAAQETDPAVAGFRYRMLESVCQFAEQKRQERSETLELRSRHATLYQEFASAHSVSLMNGEQQNQWLARFERELPNFRAAFDELERAETARPAGSPFVSSKAVHLCADLYDFWWIRGYSGEGRECCRRALAPLWRDVALSGAASLADYFQTVGTQAAALDAATALSCAAVMALASGMEEETLMESEQALDLYRHFGESRQVTAQLCNAGGIAAAAGDLAAARDFLEEALKLAREAGRPLTCAAALTNLGDVAMKQKAYDDAYAYLEEGLAFFRADGEKHGIAMALNNLGEVAVRQDDYTAAYHRFREALALRWELGDKRGISFSLRGLAGVYLGHGEACKAVMLWGVADNLREEMGGTLADDDAAHLEQKMAQARAMLSAKNPASADAVFADAWNEGRALPLESAVRWVMNEPLEN